jgi:SH3 domain protein
MLPSAQVVEVLGSHGDWSQVRVTGLGDSEKDGWVLSRYLITRVPWEHQARSLRKENTVLKEKQSRMSKELNETTSRERVLSTELQEKTKALSDLNSEYDVLKQGASGYLKLKADHGATRSDLEAAQKEIRALMEENGQLRASKRNKWFATGALVLLCGLMIGLVMGRQQRKRRSSMYY